MLRLCWWIFAELLWKLLLHKHLEQVRNMKHYIFQTTLSWKVYICPHGLLSYQNPRVPSISGSSWLDKQERLLLECQDDTSECISRHAGTWRKIPYALSNCRVQTGIADGECTPSSRLFTSRVGTTVFWYVFHHTSKASGKYL